VRELAPLLGRLVGEGVELEVAPTDEIGWVEADPADLEQILANLVLNARDAMPLGGQLRIETAVVVVGAPTARRGPSRPGRFVMLAVADSGVGMDNATQQRAFEPFFTTKARGEGTGLGLATVQAVVEASGGFVGIHSVPGLGTTIKVYLPLTDARPEAAAPARTATPAARGDETLLVVEDTRVLREVFSEVLQPEGYTVLGARDGREALRVAREHHGPIHLLVTDVVMPRLGGVDLARELKRSRPEVRVLYMSGHSQRMRARHSAPGRTEPLIEKPFTTDGLCRAVRKALDTPVADAPLQRSL
jgi:CheY-like chemotaxis protein